ESGYGRDALFEVVDFWYRERHVVSADARRALTDVDQAIFVAIDERPEKHAPDDAEDRRVGADAQCERDDDCCGEALGASESAQSEPNVLREYACHVEPAIAPDISNRIARQPHVPELFPPRAPSRRGILAGLKPL